MKLLGASASEGAHNPSPPTTKPKVLVVWVGNGHVEVLPPSPSPNNPPSFGIHSINSHKIVHTILFYFLGSKPIDFPTKIVPCRFSLNLSLFGLGPSSKGHGSNLWLLFNRIALFYRTLDLGLSF